MTATETRTEDVPPRSGGRVRFPVGFHVWLAAAAVSSLGGLVLEFALTWTASGYGPQVAGLVSGLAWLPMALIPPIGGLLGDRFGVRRVMIGCDVAMIVVAGVLTVLLHHGAPSVALLITFALVDAAVNATYSPAGNVLARLFVDEADLSLAMNRSSTAMTATRLIAPALGGLAVAALTLWGIAVLDVISFAVIIVVLLAVKPPRQQTTMSGRVGPKDLLAGLTAVRRTPGLTPMLLAVLFLAGGVIPVIALCIPLQARAHGWSASTAGLLSAGWIAGGLLLSGFFSVRRTLTRPTPMFASGPVVCAVGLLLFGWSPTAVLAGIGTVVVGLGVVMITAHLFPLYLHRCPGELQTRMTGLLLSVQAIASTVTTLLYGEVAHVASVGWATTAAAVITLGVIAVLVGPRSVRQLRTR